MVLNAEDRVKLKQQIKTNILLKTCVKDQDYAEQIARKWAEM